MDIGLSLELAAHDQFREQCKAFVSHLIDTDQFEDYLGMARDMARSEDLRLEIRSLATLAAFAIGDIAVRFFEEQDLGEQEVK